MFISIRSLVELEGLQPEMHGQVPHHDGRLDVQHLLAGNAPASPGTGATGSGTGAGTELGMIASAVGDRRGHRWARRCRGRSAPRARGAGGNQVDDRLGRGRDRCAA